MTSVSGTLDWSDNSTKDVVPAINPRGSVLDSTHALARRFRIDGWHPLDTSALGTWPRPIH